MFDNYHFQKFSKRFYEITMLRVVISRHSMKFYEIHMSLARGSNSAREGGFAMLPSFLLRMLEYNYRLQLKTLVVIIVFVYNCIYKLK
ncbi:MAG: hypothetical protein FD188_3463 [Ignavibacteria bacterium]|nr:MAG: hypothetical protein FD188_3463 [Ignavibacteria bacterium]